MARAQLRKAMFHHRHTLYSALVAHLCLCALAVSVWGQTEANKKVQTKIAEENSNNIPDISSPEFQRRAFAISLVTSLAEEARSFQDRALRPRVLARAADTLWDADSVTARTLFWRAWDAAEKGDVDELTLKTPDGVPPSAAGMITALRRRGGYDLRAEVLALAARRDRSLAEEFLSKLKQDTDETKDTRNGSRSQNSNDSLEAVLKRLNLATRLLDDGEIDRALDFAAPVLNQVNANSIGFLSKLREKRQQAADEKFTQLLTRAEFDPLADANTVSGLSSYVFTPGFYVTFDKVGNASWRQPEQSSVTIKPPNLPATIVNKFFQVAGAILLKPSPPPDEDFTSSGRIGKSMVVKRLLPLFERHAPETAVALRSQLQALSNVQRSGLTDESALLKQGLQADETGGSALERLQDQLDRAKSSRERDLIYADAAAMLASQGDTRAQDFAQKVEDAGRRAQVRRFVDFELVQFELRHKKPSQAIRFATSDQLTHSQRAWAYTQAGRLLMDTERQRGVELLEEAANQARRIEIEDPSRARLLIGVATHFFNVDRVRAWELMSEVVKAANNSEKFNGENLELHFPFASKSGLRITSICGSDFSLSNLMRSFAKDDLYRSVDMAKSFKNEAPRAVAVLAVASSLLEKNETPLK